MGKLNIASLCNLVVHCNVCRDRKGGRAWRKEISKVFSVPAGWPDFECPLGKPWGYKSTVVNWIILKHTLELPSVAVIEDVCNELLERRLDICKQCEHLCYSLPARHPVCALYSVDGVRCSKPCNFRNLLTSPAGQCPDLENDRWQSINIKPALSC